MTNPTTPSDSLRNLSDEANYAAFETLQILLADEMVLAQKLHKYYWNALDTSFKVLIEQYQVLSLRVDSIAERIRSYGMPVKGSLKEIVAMARLEEHIGVNPDAQIMISSLIADHETLIRFLEDDLKKADEHYDTDLVGFLATVQQMHEQMAWALYAYQQGDEA
jgi:starvation-inducible DNA-binding protein